MATVPTKTPTQSDGRLVRPASTTEVSTFGKKAVGEDFIDRYADYADILEAPRVMHEATAIQLVASVLNRNGVTIQYGGVQLSLDLWLLLLSGSGCGRSTLIGLATPILEKAGLRDILVDSHWGSPQAMYQNFAEKFSGLFVWGEMSEKLQLLSDKQFGGAKQWLTDRYDNLTVPDEVSFRRGATNSKNTPSIQFSTPPRTNILATSSSHWFFDHLVPGDSQGGFIPRWCILRVVETNRLVSVPKLIVEEKIPGLVKMLQQINELRGTVDISRIEKLYDDWYIATHEKFASHSDKALALAFFNRHRIHILKLAAVFEVTSNQSLVISLESWERAVRWSENLTDTILALLPTGLTQEGYKLLRLEEAIGKAGARGFSKTAVCRMFQNRRERTELLDTLKETQQIDTRWRKTSGRQGCLYVHKDYLDEYDQSHPKEK